MSIIAIIGLSISVILVIIRIYDFIKDKYRIKIKLRPRNLIHIPAYSIGSKNIPEIEYFVISITNIGREPITIINAGLLARDIRGGILFTESIANSKLLTSDCIDFKIETKELEEEKKVNIDNNKYVGYAIDSAGRVYFSHNFIKRIIRIRRIK